MQPPRASDAEPILVSELLETLTWDRQRTSEELLSFISGRQARLEDIELGI